MLDEVAEAGEQREDDRAQDEREEPGGSESSTVSVERVLGFIIVALVAYRLAYHASYLGEVPFAHATFSDGAVYEQAARDILDHPPLGSRAFYLQGAYAYLLAAGMAVHAWPSLGLLVQLVVAGLALWLFHRSALRLWGRRAGLLASAVLLAHPGLAFYENKYLSAELGIACNIVVLAAFVAVLRERVGEHAQARDEGSSRRSRWSWLLKLAGLGAASGLAVLARPNLILALPFSLVAAALALDPPAPTRAARARRWSLATAAFGLGALLAVAPMAARNHAVTGHPDIGPVHGGGTSFFIGNNPKSKGVWNDGGLLSARLGTESQELAAVLGVDPEQPERERAAAIGAALYERAWTWIRANPGAWLRLEAHKLWLTVGDEQLTQDYDWLGEQELLPWAHRVGVPFSLLMALAWLGAVALRRVGREPARGDEHTPRFDGRRRWALAMFLAGQLLAPLAANVLFFTSAQHRVPLAVPLALLAGPGLLALGRAIQTWRAARAGGSKSPAGALVPSWALLVALALVAQGLAWKRTKRTHPHPVHYYNLAMVQDTIGEPRDALASLNRAIELRPDQAIFHLRRAHLRLRLGDFDGAEADLDRVEALAEVQPLPAWILDQAELDRHSVFVERMNAGQRGRPGGRFR